VLLASRDGERFLDEALSSLAAQTWRDLEIVAVDDGSRDGTRALLQRFAGAHRGVTVLDTPGIGLAGALTVAARHARGELLARHDDDDRSHPQRLERQVAFLLRQPDVVVVGTGAEIIDERGVVIGRYPVPTAPGQLRRRLRRAPPFVHGSVLMRRDAYERAGGYRQGFAASQDFDLWLRLPPDARLANLGDPLYQWRLHPGGVFRRARDEQLRFHALARVFAEERRERGVDSIEQLRQAGTFEQFLQHYPRAGRLLTRLGENYVREGRLAEARALLFRAMATPGARGGALAWFAASFLRVPLTPPRSPSEHPPTDSA
jgi:glycosyltransferase involved in cell wall biosynthesis